MTNLQETLNLYDRYGDICEVNTDLLNEDVKKATDRFIFILNQVSKEGNFNNYPGDKNNLIKDIMDVVITKHKEIFGEFKE